MGIGTYAVGNEGQRIQDTSFIIGGRGIPEAHHQGNAQDLHDFYHIDRFTLDQHLVGHGTCYDNGKQSTQCHTHLENPPEGTL